MHLTAFTTYRTGRDPNLVHVDLVGTVSQVAIPIALHDWTCAPRKTSATGLPVSKEANSLDIDNRRQNDEKQKVEISPKVKGWRCPPSISLSRNAVTSPVNESTHAAKN
jgi:hypothetical protein